MGVQKFKTFDEARRALWLPAGDPRILERMRRLAEMRQPHGQVRHGVYRFRTIEEAKVRSKRPHA
ncbi:MAG: hypothetical protein HY270_19610 [Deltaproteobacteria bacterium]|nr:hypothetical protein [Deltaproteobacteria bacterium]